MKRVLILAAVAVVVGLMFPVSNLIVGLPTSPSLTGIETDDAQFKQALDAFAQKCVNCHTEDYKLPFYARLPVAKGIIEYDIKLGTEYLDMAKAFSVPSDQPVSEVVLAKNEYVVDHGTMPPMRYLALHWNGGLSSEERDSILTWVKETRKAHFAAADAPDALKDHVLQPIPKKHGQDPKKVAMGNKLFHDGRLSKDNSISCSSCHGLDKGGTDQSQFATGVGDAMGDINSPTVFNAGFQFAQFWDGRAADLEEQADGPVNNPIEMASNWPEAIGKLSKDEALTAEFTALYPSGWSKDNIIDAIATFERTLITPNSAFDKFLAGDQAAMSEDAKQGYQQFLDLSCATCHVGIAMGGQSYEKMGRKADYFGDRGNVGKADNGRFNVTEDEADRHKLKTPTLRNIALTHPYMHDGSTSDLGEAVDIMAKYMVGKSVSKGQNGQIVAFLNALTGEYEGKLLQ